MTPIPLIAIVGPTASGKSDFAVELAIHLKQHSNIVCEIISADSRQVYSGMNIGTGKITKKEMKGVQHHLLDIISPKKIYTVSDFVRDAKLAIDDIISRGHMPIICGGTGFYIDALLYGLHIPEVPADPTLRARLSKKSTAQLFSILLKKDPERAATIDQHNPVRLIRALEIVKALGKVPDSANKCTAYHSLIIGINPDDDTLRANINRRLVLRLKKGMVNEAKRLHKAGVSWKRMEMLGLEYRFMALHLKGRLTREEMVTQLETAIWQYVKRQRTWFKRNKDIIWLS